VPDQEIERTEELARPPGDSREQRDAEAVMIAVLGAELGVELEPRSIDLADGRRVEIDGVSKDFSVMAEAWAHQGTPKPAQRNKVLSDALKLAFLARANPATRRLILLRSDEKAAAPFRGSSWYAGALAEFGIEVRVVELPDDLRARVRDAQVRQFR
jgi:hypothetical protein